MMNQEAFDRWCVANALTPKAIQYLTHVRTSDPSRTLRNRGGSNITGFYPSKKMGVIVHFESVTVELPAIYLLDLDPTVLEFFEQPQAIELKYLDRSGHRLSVHSTPDFLVIRENEAVLQEWKPEAKLRELAESMPNRFFRTDDGKWHCPPGEEAAEAMGLKYEVHSAAELNSVLIRNINYLSDYYRADTPPVSQQIKRQGHLFAVNKQRSTERIGKFMETITDKEVLQQRERDRQSRQILTFVETGVMPTNEMSVQMDSGQEEESAQGNFSNGSVNAFEGRLIQLPATPVIDDLETF